LRIPGFTGDEKPNYHVVMPRKILSAIAVAVFCVAVWLFIQKRGEPPPPPELTLPGVTALGR